MTLLDLEEKKRIDSGIQTWSLDASHSYAGFTVKHMMISNVRGEFKELEGSLQFDPEQIENSNVQITLKSASISTGDDKRDAHLKSDDFFAVEKHPDVTFRSTKFEKKSDDEILVRGDLSIAGTTREVSLTVEGPTAELSDPWGGHRIGFSGATKINRKDFGLLWNVALEAGGVLVAEDVSINFDAEFVRS